MPGGHVRRQDGGRQGLTGFVVARARARRLLVAAALLTVVPATCVLTALAAFSAAVGDAGLRHTLEHRAAARTVLDIRSDVTAEDRRTTDAAVREAAAGAFDGLPVTVTASTGTGAYALPASTRRGHEPTATGRGHDSRPDGDAPPDRAPPDGAPSGGPPSDRPPDGAQDRTPELTRFATLPRDHVRMVAGSWPGAPPRPPDVRGGSARAPATVRAAVPQRAAQRLGLHLGDTLRVTSRLHGPPDVRVEITGIYTPVSPGSATWRSLDPLHGEGVAVGDFTSYGPLAVPGSAFASGPAPHRTGGPLWPAETRWQADADFTSFDSSRIGHLRSRVAHTVEALGTSPRAPHAVARTDLPGLLASLERTLLVTRSALLITALQLVLLTGLTLLLVAQLLRTERAAETALLRARGASRARICALAAAEAFLLALPAALAAPLLTGPALRLLSAHGAPDGAGLLPPAGPGAGTWWTAAAVAAGCALLLTGPTLLARGTAGPHDPDRRATGRPRPTRRRATVTVLRGGVDLALVVLAVVAYAQLAGRRSEATGALTPSGAGGVLGIDPLLVAAPALALLAGTALVLRLLPLAARLGERYAARQRGLAGALAGWQLARRPQRAARPALLLVLAVATGVLAVGQGASWDRSQDDQADFRTGADLTVSGSAPSPLAQGGLFDDVPGITRAAPVVRTTVTTDGSREARLLATDTAAAADGVLRLRDDLAGRPLPRLLRPLAGKGAGRRAGLRLPPGTDRLALRLRLDGPGRARGPAAARSGLALAVTVTDRFGVPYRLPLGDIPADGRTHTLTARLTDGGGSPAGPLRLTRIGVSHHVPRHDAGRRLTVEALHAHGRFGHRTVHPATASRWTPRVRPDDASTASGGQYAVATARPARVRPRGAPVTLRWTTGSAPAPKPDGNDGPGTVSVEWKPHEAAAAPLAAVATDSYLRAGGSTVGDTVTVRVADTELDVRITGAVRALPTVTPRDSDDGQPDAGALLCDLGALDRALADRGADPLEPRTWWLSAESGGTARAAQALRDRPAVGTVRVRDEIADALRSDPLGAGPRSALTALVPAAALLSATGFAVAAAGAARERAGDLAVLRALGAPRRRLARAVAAEQGLVVALSAALGLALGTVLTRLFVPLLVVTGEGRAPVPDLLVRLPPGPLAWLVAAALAVPLLVVAGTALRRPAPAPALRTEREG